MRKCKVRTCQNEVDSAKFVHCKACRVKHRQQHIAAEEKRPEGYRAVRREYIKGYCERNPHYRKWHEAARRRASAAWIARNRDRKRLTNRLNGLVQAGRIKKPECCQECGARTKLVGFGIRATSTKIGIKVSKWLCWMHWWAADRAAKAKLAKKRPA
jgi:hypothetical protein